LQQSVNLNGIPPGADFLAKNQDLSNPGKPLAFPDAVSWAGQYPYITYDATSN
jgi:hypothetical protein